MALSPLDYLLIVVVVALLWAARNIGKWRK
jgi:hypothetical protein